MSPWELIMCLQKTSIWQVQRTILNVDFCGWKLTSTTFSYQGKVHARATLQQSFFNNLVGISTWNSRIKLSKWYMWGTKVHIHAVLLHYTRCNYGDSPFAISPFLYVYIRSKCSYFSWSQIYIMVSPSLSLHFSKPFILNYRYEIHDFCPLSVRASGPLRVNPLRP